MRFGSTKTWGIGAAAAGLLFAAYSIGTQADGGVASGADLKARLVAGPGPGPGRPAGPMLQDVADRLGVDRQKLEDAITAIRGQQQPPPRGPRDDFAADLAAKLGIDQAKVQKVLDAHRPKPPEPPAGPGRRTERHEITGSLAKELGVSEAKVRAALQSLKRSAGAPHGPDELANALATKLGISKDKVQAALGKIGPPGAPRFRTGHRGPAAPGGPPGPDIATLAKDLGVDEAKLKTALDELRKQHEADFKARRDEFAKQLADRLGIDVAKVKAALPEPPHPPFRARP